MNKSVKDILIMISALTFGSILNYYVHGDLDRTVLIFIGLLLGTIYGYVVGRTYKK